MSDKQAQHWERQRRRGPVRFVLVHGVLIWGLLTAVLASGLSPFFGDSRSFLEALPRNLIAFPIGGGILFGPIVWLWSEYSYRRWREARHEQASHGS